MSSVQVKVEINDATIKRKLDSLIDSRTMLQIHNLLAKMCDPYVPFLEGPLSQTVEVTPKSVKYVQPYARRQYYGTDFNHTTDYHPQATALWDKAMMRDRREEFVEQVRQILRQRAREIYG